VQSRERQAGSSQFADSTVPLKGRAAPLLPVLVRAVDASGSSVTFRLSAGVCLIGTSKGAHLRVADPAVSRQHCELELTAGGVLLTDLESTNGTFYLGQRVERMALSVGSSFSVGSATIRIESEFDRASLEPSSKGELFGMHADSLAMRRVFALIERLAGGTLPVLIEGESGVGKETCARAIHATSNVAGGPFVALRCGALGGSALAAALFGDGGVPGTVELASGGTLFLDHVDALTPEVQRSVLPLLEGGATCRLVASSAPGLAERTERDFHQGLYFSLAVVRIELPPLRERRDDIACLATQFAREFGVGLPADVVEQLRSRSWPGNVRELRGAVQAYAALGVVPSPARVKGGLLELALEEAVDLGTPYATQKDALVDRFTRRYLDALMQRAGGNQSVASRLADLDRTYLGKMLAKYGMKD
jgi:DNA-binding NtrC family response regulator